jgi:hypothetical protein
MVVKEKAPAPEFVNKSNQENEVRRVAGMNHIKSMAPRNLDRQAQFVKKCAPILEKITKCAVRFVHEGVTVDVNPINLLVPLLGTFSDRTNDGNLVACGT